MGSLSSLSDTDLVTRMRALVLAERAASAEVVEHLIEIDQRRLFLEQACSSLYAYCMERLGYSENGAIKRVRVARLAERVPRVLEELRSSHSLDRPFLALAAPHRTERRGALAALPRQVAAQAGKAHRRLVSAARRTAEGRGVGQAFCE